MEDDYGPSTFCKEDLEVSGTSLLSLVLQATTEKDVPTDLPAEGGRVVGEKEDIRSHVCWCRQSEWLQ